MLNEFDNFDASRFESDDQLRLRERFDSIADRNALEIVMFDPYELNTVRKIRTDSGEKEIEEAEPALASLLRSQMLKTAQLDAPTDQDDPRLIVNRHFRNGVKATIFTVTRDDESYVPVYFETTTDGVTPRMMLLMSFDKVEETVLHYRNLDEYRSRLSSKLNIGDAVLTRLSVAQLKSFDATLDDIRSL